MKAVFLRDLRAYATTMAGWCFCALVLLFIGIYMMVYNLNYGYGNFEYVLSASSFIYLMAIPVLTMRSFAEERRQGTDALLYSLPIPSWRIAVGKLLAMAAVLAVPALVSCTYPLILSLFGTIYLPTAYLSILAFYLLGLALAAIGMFASSLCESQATAAAACFALLLADYFLPSLSSFVPSGTIWAVGFGTVVIALCVIGLIALTKNPLFSILVGIVVEVALILVAVLGDGVLDGFVPDLLDGLSLFDRFYPFVNGIVDVASLAVYLGTTAIFVVLATNSFEKRRWS